MKIELKDNLFLINCPSCDEFLECDALGSSAEHGSAMVACGTWAAHHICYKRRVNIARETGALANKN